MVVFTLLLTLYILFHNPNVQTYTARITAEYLSKKLNTEIRIKELTVSAFFDIILKGVDIKDLNHQTILKAERIQLNIQKTSLRNRNLNLSKIILDACSFNLAISENDSVSNLSNLLNAIYTNKNITQKKDTSLSQIESWKIVCKAIEINDGSFSLVNENKAKRPRGVDFYHIDIVNLNLDVDNLSLIGDSLVMRVNELNLKDQNSGFIIDSFEGDFLLSNNILDSKNLKVKVMDSNLDLDFSFEYDSFKDFIDFEEKIRIKTKIRPTRLNLADVGYFAPQLFIMENVINFSLEAEGRVSDFKSKNMLLDYGELTHFDGDVNMKGLPFIETTYNFVNIRNFTTSAKDIESFAIPGKSTFIDLSDEFLKLGKCDLIGNIEGVYNDFDANIAMRTEAGNFFTDMKMTTNESGELTRYTGRMRSIHFDVGKVFDAENFVGEMDFDIDFDGSGLIKKDLVLIMNGVVDSLYFKGNVYNHLNVNGRLFDNKFFGNLNIVDEDIELNFDGLIDHSKQIPAYDFKASIHNAQLYNLKLFEYNPTAVLSTNLNINFSGSDPDNYIGFIQFDSTIYQQDGKDYYAEQITIDAKRLADEKKRIEIKSDYIDADLSGEFSFKDLLQSVNEHLALYMPVIFSDSTKVFDSIPPQNFEFNIELKNTADLTEIFFPDLQLSKNSIVHGLYNSEENSIHFEANADQLIYRGIRFDKCYAKTNNTEDAFQILLGSNDMVFKEATEKDTVSLGLENLNVLATIQHDSIDYRLRWDDFEDINENTGYLAGYLKYFSPEHSQLKIYRSNFLVNNEVLNLDANNSIVFDSTRIVIRDFNISIDDKRFGFEGVISENSMDTVRIEFDNWQLSNFDIFINNPNLDIDGSINGHLSFANIYDAPNIDADLVIDDLIFNKEVLGKGSVKTEWNPFEKILYSHIEIVSQNDPSLKFVEMSGTYIPGAAEQQLNYDLKLDQFSFNTLEPFVSTFISDLGGFASGDFKISGSISKPVIVGELELIGTEAKIDYLNVNYHLSNIVQFRENEIQFAEVIVQDSLGNIASSSGRITHNYFYDFDFDIRLFPQDVVCLNTNQTQNNLFYGNALASGDIHIHGPINNIIMDVTLISEKGTEIVIPLNNSLELTETDYIVFINTKDTVHETTDYTVDLTGFSINLNLSVTEDAEIELLLPYSMGRISADGNSEMSIKVNSRGDFEIIGDYIINQGSFLFTLQNIINRRFSIIKGGKISWNGNPYEALIDVRALYKTKASLAEIEPDLTRRVNVDCYLSLKEQLFDPIIDFSFKLPNVDKSTEQLTFAMIDTTNDAVMNQQLIYLLVLGSFSYDQVNTASIGASSFNLISNQLSNWLSQISKDFDIGINYRPGDDISREEVEVALSTQFFDNRVTIDGNVGVIGLQNTSTAASDIVGDVNIEVKITDDGRFRIKAFNRSNVSSIESVNEYDNLAPNTQGVGIFYRKEFDSFSDLFKRKKNKPKKTKEKSDKNKKSDADEVKED